ncbi:unnamed protein product [Heterobilharzia americana]|nr:unnamed protein product [Heterobilharzia americana]
MPKLLSKYANDLINTKAMNMYGITNDNDKLQIMAITSSWISKIHILHEVTIRCCLKSQLREVRTLGLTHIQLNIDMMKCFQSIPAGWNRTKVAVQIANKLIQSKCFYYMERLDELIRLGKLWQKVNEDPMTYHICGKYLTNNEKNMLLDDACNLFGRLITFLKYSEPKSELFTYKYLKSNDQTLERLYSDYSDKWEAIVKVFYCTDKLDPTGDYTDQLKNLQLIPNNFKPDENTIRLCRKLFIKIPENLSI